jgi:hypothetical protein
VANHYNLISVRISFTILLILSALAVSGRQVYTIQSGAWEEDSIWYNNIRPGYFDDTISVYHHIDLNSDISLGLKAFLFVDSSASICGDHVLRMDTGSFFYNLGFVGLYHIIIHFAEGQNVFPGTIDLGEAGMEVHGGRFLNDRGCFRVHRGRQFCITELDTSLSTSTTLNVSDFTTTEQAVFYDYGFGDGTTLHTWETHVSHTYTDSGEFTVQVIMYNCWARDTVYRKVVIELPEPPPPPCVNKQAYIIYPNPTDEGFWIKNEFCEDEEVQVNIYTVTAQLAGSYSFHTSEKILLEYTSCFLLSAATYIVDIQAASKSQKLKLVLVDDDY